MKILFPVILLSVFLVSCTDVSRQRSNSGESPSKDSGQSTMPQASEVIKEEPLETNAIFPHIKPVYRALNLRWIEAYCRSCCIGRLDSDCIRLFCQPMGYVAEAIEIDLINQQLTVYPGTHSNKEVVQTPLDKEQAAWIRALVTSEKFQEIPTENEKIGMDGTSYLLEALIDDLYIWKLHWIPEDEEFIKVVNHIRLLAKDKIAE